ncbi:thiol-disulfide oxidoreductase LTO1 isoform X2 [Rhodamnia argentea]|uniref:Thiol-disulfide oxidoreductase LTO1 isoform X2 n=1 Tax=Rhodamnia argentea TaxID=178133 RepID=A0A8B8PNL7_9MYRT|nr:thiol-disulfide oxidoreductase LTO1 isoform X2 [Rhodamnia argentea]
MARLLNAPPSSPFLSNLTASLRLVPPPFARRSLQFKVKCSSSGESQESESEAGTSSLSSATAGAASSSSGSTYKLCAGIGGVGFCETAYLTYLKLTNSDAFCPIGGSSCGDVLNSDYASVFGIPLPLIGMIAYGTVAALGIRLTGKDFPFGLGESNGRLVLLGITTSMATASAYFLYLLSTKFSGASCSYCLLSALLSFSLFLVTIKDFGFEEIQKTMGLQLCMVSLVVVTLSTAYSTTQSIPSSLAEMEIPFFTTEITTPSSTFAVSLARHLHSIGAKMYGAFWCSHCLEQKQMFGRDAAKILDYVECFPDGYKKGTKIAKQCADVGIEGFPTWLINGFERRARIVRACPSIWI